MLAYLGRLPAVATAKQQECERARQVDIPVKPSETRQPVDAFNVLRQVPSPANDPELVELGKSFMKQLMRQWTVNPQRPCVHPGLEFDGRSLDRTQRNPLAIMASTR
jgi:hypothetical protein